MPAVTWRPTRDTNWTIIANYQKDTTGSSTAFLPHSGTIFPNPNGRIPINRFAGDPSFDLYRTETKSIASLFEHRLSDTVKIAHNMRYSDVDGVYNTAYVDSFSNPANPYVDPAQRQVNRFVESWLSNRKTFTSDTNMELKFATGPVSHKVLVGLDFRRVNERGDYGSTYDANPFDLFSPSYNGVPTPVLAPTPGILQKQAGTLYPGSDQPRLADRRVRPAS